MLTREQLYTMLMLRHREDNIFSVLPDELINHIGNINNHPDSEINVALRFAASGVEEDMIELVKMVTANPRILLQAGTVMTRGGVPVVRTMLYEFFLCEGDPAGAKRIDFGFTELSKLKDIEGKFIDGEKEHHCQYERCRPHIEAVVKQVESKSPVFDLKPLFDIIKQSTPDDIKAVLAKDMTHESALRNALAGFREAVRPKKKTVGMHYEHYTTLQQAFDLLYKERKELSSNYTNYDKCDLIWRQIIGYLQRSLPAVDRFAFARGFDDEERTLQFKYGTGFYPDCRDAEGDLELIGFGLENAIYGGMRVVAGPHGTGASWKTHVEQKISDLQNLCSHTIERSEQLGA